MKDKYLGLNDYEAGIMAAIEEFKNLCKYRSDEVAISAKHLIDCTGNKLSPIEFITLINALIKAKME